MKSQDYRRIFQDKRQKIFFWILGFVQDDNCRKKIGLVVSRHQAQASAGQNIIRR
jgi:hypothetical protein